MHFYPVSYSYYRSGSDVGLGAGQRRYSTREVEPTDSGDSTLSDLDGKYLFIRLRSLYNFVPLVVGCRYIKTKRSYFYTF